MYVCMHVCALASHWIDHFSTYYHQATFIHGFSFTSPGIPPDLFGRVFCHTMDELFYEVFQDNSSLPIPDHPLVFNKRIQKLQFLRKVVENRDHNTEAVLQARGIALSLLWSTSTRTAHQDSLHLDKQWNFPLTAWQRSVLGTIATKRGTVSQTCTCLSVQFAVI